MDPVRWVSVPTPRAPDFGLFVLEDPDAPLEALTDAEFAAAGERMPYFGTLWPAGASLAAAILEGPALAGRRVLDLGCGAGTAGLAALRRGAGTTFLDWEPRALGLVARSAAVLGLEPAALVEADWAAPPADLGAFDRVLAADVLYEARDAAPLAAVLPRLLLPEGEAWLADPGRPFLDDFLAAAGRQGLVVRERGPLPARSHGVDVTRVRLTRGG